MIGLQGIAAASLPRLHVGFLTTTSAFVTRNLPTRVYTVIALHPSSAMSSAAAATADSPGLLDRVQNFVSDNRRAVLIGAAAAAVAVGGAAYYAASTSRRAPSVAGSEPDLEKADSKGKKKPKSKKRKPAKDNDGPILEERRPKVEEVADSGACWQSLVYHYADSDNPCNFR